MTPLSLNQGCLVLSIKLFPNSQIQKEGNFFFGSGKMLLVRIVGNNKIYDYLGQVRLSKG